MSDNVSALASYTIDINDHDLSSSLYNPNYTQSYDKISCVREFFFVHMVLNYFIFLSGIFCFLTRMGPDRYKWLHSWSGRVYIISMFLSTASSLLINNTGLPLSTLIMFGNCFGGLCIGWIVIVIYKERMQRSAILLVEKRLQSGSGSGNSDGHPILSLERMMLQAKADINFSKTFVQRFFSLKALHGILFFSSWFSIAGRMFSSNQSGDYTCHTYPVYKPIDTPEGDYAGKNFTLVPRRNPDYDKLPWAGGETAWSLMIISVSIVVAAVIGMAVSCVAARKSSNKTISLQSSTSIESPQEDVQVVVNEAVVVRDGP